MSNRQRFTTGNPFERQIGFSRAVRVGGMVSTAGTVAMDAEGRTQGTTCADQMRYILRKLEGVLQQAGAQLADVVRVVCYLIDFADAGEFAVVHAEFFSGIKPAATCVVVKQLFGEGTRVEIELTAVVAERSQATAAAG